MLGVTMQESGVSKIIALRLDDDMDKIKNDIDDDSEPFIEEDVEPEKNVYIPPRPIRKVRTIETVGENQATEAIVESKAIAPTEEVKENISEETHE